MNNITAEDIIVTPYTFRCRYKKELTYGGFIYSEIYEKELLTEGAIQVFYNKDIFIYVNKKTDFLEKIDILNNTFLYEPITEEITSIIKYKFCSLINEFISQDVMWIDPKYITKYMYHIINKNEHFDLIKATL